MTFIVDREKLRTFDPDRGYELFTEGGGSDGTVRFKLVGLEGAYHFSANTSDDELRPSEVEKLGSDNDRSPMVWCIHNWNDHWKPIIREAMNAYKAAHGFESPNFTYFVRFGTLESIFDA